MPSRHLGTFVGHRRRRAALDLACDLVSCAIVFGFIAILAWGA